MWVEVKDARAPLVIGCIYRPPSAPVGAWLQFEDHFESSIQLRPKSDVILTGDFNVDCLDPTHPHQSHLKHFLATFNLENHVTAPTRISPQRSSCLDLFLTSEELPVVGCKVCPAETVNTDHDLVLLSLSRISSKPQRKTSCRPSRAMFKIKHEIFSQDIEQSDFLSVDAAENVDQLWQDWHTKMMTILDKHAPLKRRHCRRRHRLCPWSTPALRHLVHLRHVAHHRLLKNPTDNSAREAFLDLRKRCPDLSHSLKNVYFKEKCRTYSKNPRLLWNTMNMLTGRV